MFVSNLILVRTTVKMGREDILGRILESSTLRTDA